MLWLTGAVVLPPPLHLLLHQRCFQTHPATPSSSNSLRLSSQPPSSPAPLSRLQSTFRWWVQFLELQLRWCRLQLKRPRLPAAGPSRRHACGQATLYEASPTHCWPHPWAPLTPRCTLPWCHNPVSRNTWCHDDITEQQWIQSCLADFMRTKSSTLIECRSEVSNKSQEVNSSLYAWGKGLHDLCRCSCLVLKLFSSTWP